MRYPQHCLISEAEDKRTLKIIHMARPTLQQDPIIETQVFSPSSLSSGTVDTEVLLSSL